MRTKNLLPFVLCAFMGLGVVSCKKDNNNGSTTVTTDDAADAVAQAVSPESAGLVTQTQNAALVVSTTTLSCGGTDSKSVSGQNQPGAAVTYSYSFASNSQLICNNGIPQRFQYNFTGKSGYDAPRISSDDSSEAQFTIDGLAPGASQYVFNQSYIRYGSESSKVRQKRSFTSTITITSSNITVDKQTQLIVSGTASVDVKGAGSDGRAFEYSGTLTFIGNKQATLTLGNGNSYSISW